MHMQADSKQGARRSARHTARGGVATHGALVALGALALLAAPEAAHAIGDAAIERAARAIDAPGMRAKVEHLASDAMQGREAGSEGNRAAARYIAEHLHGLGLEPLGTDRDDAEPWRRYLHHFRWSGIDCHNVVALWPGTGDPARDGYVVVGAHYDHLGRGDSGSLAFFRGRGELHHGADDNASGVAAVLEIAEALAALKERPRLAIVLALFDAEEKGLIGAERLAADPPFPLDRCRAKINLDMVGRAESDRVTVYCATSGDGLPELFADASRAAGLALDVRPFSLPNSDHHSFYRRGVPSGFLTTGLHEDYHRPSDTADKVEIGPLTGIAETGFRVALAAATREEAFAYREIPSLPPGAMILEAVAGLTGVRAFAGAQDAMYGEVHGAVLVPGARGLEATYVLRGSAMDRAGLERGDRIVEADGRSTTGRLGRASLALALLDAEAALVVRRGDERLAIDVRAEAEEAPSRERREPAEPHAPGTPAEPRTPSPKGPLEPF